jgi:hypothetical protein
MTLHYSEHEDARFANTIDDHVFAHGGGPSARRLFGGQARDAATLHLSGQLPQGLLIEHVSASYIERRTETLLSALA